MTELHVPLILAAAGPYFSIVKIIVMLVLAVPWLRAATWVHKDTRVVRSPQLMWSALVLGAGAAGVALWLLLPWFAAGLLAYLVLAGGAIVAYVFDRNRRVVPEARVLTAEHIVAFLKRTHREVVKVDQRLKLYNHLGKAVHPPEEDLPAERTAYNLAQELLHAVVVGRASEADLSPAAGDYLPRFVIDGVIHKQPAMPKESAEAMIDYVKKIAGLAVEDKRRPQTGKISMDVGAVRADMKVTAAGTTEGQRLGLKVMQEVARTNLNELGMPDEMRKRLEQLNAAKGGLIIVSGPRGNGVTSTLYSLLRKHDAFTQQLATLESTVVVEQENITQEPYKDQIDLAGKLASRLRRDPDVVMIDQCSTTQVANLIVDAAPHVNILLGANAESVFVALAKWIKACGGESKKALSILRGVTCQVLLRKLCPDCREAFRPAKEMLAKLNIPAEGVEVLYRTPTAPLVDEKGRPRTCETCNGTGYLGRTAAFQMLQFNEEIRTLIGEGAPLNRIKAACRKNGLLHLQEEALHKFIAGETSMEEVVRVTKGKE